jgi:hypothetical protein
MPTANTTPPTQSEIENYYATLNTEKLNLPLPIMLQMETPIAVFDIAFFIAVNLKRLSTYKAGSNNHYYALQCLTQLKNQLNQNE